MLLEKLLELLKGWAPAFPRAAHVRAGHCAGRGLALRAGASHPHARHLFSRAPAPGLERRLQTFQPESMAGPRPLCARPPDSASPNTVPNTSSSAWTLTRRETLGQKS